MARALEHEGSGCGLVGSRGQSGSSKRGIDALSRGSRWGFTPETIALRCHVVPPKGAPVPSDEDPHGCAPVTTWGRSVSCSAFEATRFLGRGHRCPLARLEIGVNTDGNRSRSPEKSSATLPALPRRNPLPRPSRPSGTPTSYPGGTCGLEKEPSVSERSLRPREGVTALDDGSWFSTKPTRSI